MAPTWKNQLFRMKKYILYDKKDFWVVMHYPKLAHFSAFKIEDAAKAYEEVKEMRQFELVKRIEPPQSFLTQSNGDWWHYSFCLPLFHEIEVFEIK